MGISVSLGCFNCWMCQPTYLKIVRDTDCCLSGGCYHGLGCTFWLWGQYCCTPHYLVAFSIRDHIDTKRPLLGDIKITEVELPGGKSTQQMINKRGYWSLKSLISKLFISNLLPTSFKYYERSWFLKTVRHVSLQ